MQERSVNTKYKIEPKAAKARQEVVRIFMEQAAGARDNVQQIFLETAVTFVKKTMAIDSRKNRV